MQNLFYTSLFCFILLLFIHSGSDSMAVTAQSVTTAFPTESPTEKPFPSTHRPTFKPTNYPTVQPQYLDAYTQVTPQQKGVIIGLSAGIGGFMILYLVWYRFCRSPPRSPAEQDGYKLYGTNTDARGHEVYHSPLRNVTWLIGNARITDRGKTIPANLKDFGLTVRSMPLNSLFPHIHFSVHKQIYVLV